MPRIEPLPVEKWTPSLAAVFAAVTSPLALWPPDDTAERSKTLEFAGTLAHHPGLAEAVLTFGGYFLKSATLTPRHRDMLVVRVAILRSPGNDAARHVFLAAGDGIDDEDVARVALGPSAPCWSDLDAALLRAVDELIGAGAISRATWTTLAREFDEQQLLDLIFTVGAYETMAWMLRSAEVEFGRDVDKAVAAQGVRAPDHNSDSDAQYVGVPSGGWT